MTGSASWIVMIPIVLGLIAIALLLWDGARAERGFYVEERSFRCPQFRRKVVATLVRSGPSGRILGVRCCTGLPNHDLVTCEKECVAELQRVAAANEPAKAIPPGSVAPPGRAVPR
jgi:hypothetical protein